MKKSNKVVLAQPAATAPRLLPRAPGPVRGPAGAGGESHRARLRYQSLLQDYKELLKVRPRSGSRLRLFPRFPICSWLEAVFDQFFFGGFLVLDLILGDFTVVFLSVSFLLQLLFCFLGVFCWWSSWWIWCFVRLLISNFRG
jgi:hypothetical protein